MGVLILAGSWLLLLSGVAESTVTVLRIVVMFVGIVVIVAVSKPLTRTNKI